MTSELRVLQIAQDHPDWTPGGSEILAHDLARALDARPGVTARLLVAATDLHRPDAAAGSLGAFGEDLVLRTGAYDRFTLLRADGAEWIDSLGRALAETRPHVVHLHGLQRLGAEIVPALRRLAPRARIALTLHDYHLICANEGLLLTAPEGARCRGAEPDRCRRCFPEIAAARHALRRAHLLALLDGVDVFLAPSAFLRDRHIDWGLDPARIRVLPNAVVAPEPIRPPEPRVRRDRFAFFGAIAERKGVLTLLDAAARLKAAGAEVEIALHGGFGWAEAGFRTRFAEALATAAPVARHLGPYDRSEIGALMARTDWVVAPSIWWENAPLVLLEARAAGRPAIVSGVGGMAEMVTDGLDGLHAPAGDPVGLVDALRRAAETPGLWDRLAAAIRPVRHRAFVDMHLWLYRSLRERATA